MDSLIDANTLFGFWPKRKVDISPNKLLEIMAKHKVKRFLSLSTAGIFYDYEEGNQETLQLSRNSQQVIPVATVDPRKYFGNETLVSKLTETGFKILRLFPDLQNWPLDYEPFLNIVAEASTINLPLMISAVGLGGITKIGTISDDYEIPIVITNVNYNQFSEALAVTKNHKNILLETSLLDTPDAYEIFVQELGAERLIFGSYSPVHYFSASFLPLERAEISNEEKQLICKENIERLLK